MKHVTIGIITYKRPLWLKRLLLELMKQKAEGFSFSILVVDNANDAETQQVVRSFSQNNIEISYFVESNRGIVSARNRVVSECSKTDAHYLAFIDDDEWPENDLWLQRLFVVAENENVDIVTSHVISVNEEMSKNWATEILYPKNTLTERERVKVFYTNNVLLSTSMLSKMSPCFDERFAMTGASDYHFSLKCQLAGYECVYAHSPVLEELPNSRANLKWFCRRGFRSGIGYTRAHLFEEAFLKVVVKCFILSGVRFIRGTALIIQSLVIRNKSCLANGLFRLCSSVGTLAGFLGIKHQEYKYTHGK